MTLDHTCVRGLNEIQQYGYYVKKRDECIKMMSMRFLSCYVTVPQIKWCVMMET